MFFKNGEAIGLESWYRIPIISPVYILLGEL